MARAKSINVFSHWYHLVENLQASPLEFYDSVEKAIERRTVPDSRRTRIDCREGGPLSAKREYLRVKRKEYVFDICGAPFGNGFFVSWWLGGLPSRFVAMLVALSAIPVLGWLFVLPIRLSTRSMTYYQIDTATMFQESVRSAVLEVVDGLTKAKGLRAPTDLERKPILGELFRRQVQG